MESIIIVAIVVLISTLIQTISGFGIALVAMPILTSMIGISIASPLVALIAFATRIVILVRYRDAFNIHAVLQLVAASVIGVQFGGALFRVLDERTMKVILALIIIGYALYALLKLRLPSMQHSTWAYGMGFVSGVLSGAYNVGGPPLVIYANCRGWDAEAFKSNLQGVAFFNGITVLINQFMNGRITPLIWETFMLLLPAVIIGSWLGLYADKHIDEVRFRKVVLLVLLALGIQLLF